MAQYSRHDGLDALFSEGNGPLHDVCLAFRQNVGLDVHLEQLGKFSLGKLQLASTSEKLGAGHQ